MMFQGVVPAAQVCEVGNFGGTAMFCGNRMVQIAFLYGDPAAGKPAVHIAGGKCSALFFTGPVAIDG